jgi:hypothetical protein
MKSPPLLDWLTGSAGGGCVSAIRLGCGTLVEDFCGVVACATAGTIGADNAAAAAASGALFRNLRRLPVERWPGSSDIG